MEIGLVHVYCGNGKGKTTSAIGQGIRATGRGLKVIMIQFLKGKPTGELKTLAKLEPDFKVFRFEKERNFFNNLTLTEKDELKMEIENAMKFARKIFETKECDILILDEILGVLQNKIISEENFGDFIKSKPYNMELILTGRILPDSLKEYADYISEINIIKHPYESGIKAREGIEY
ncbi:MAG: cob(I)yrinic acid a,c-diamide adenosyltransferase [Firmicutes bacterium HGW-Firmicutes-7]|nr:MAG: cob(I)yrinic acid a,c-diamide adenosyltransferase [Firmicutes bacterium HGW-Firmicutes-7]